MRQLVTLVRSVAIAASLETGTRLALLFFTTLDIERAATTWGIRAGKLALAQVRPPVGLSLALILLICFLVLAFVSSVVLRIGRQKDGASTDQDHGKSDRTR